ncbi:hypothetical protein AN214_03783 [Pseudoalteromonas sp. P1-9]|nr:hypothetical protein AN214_03783 [Pseudoalteromonas sp. P1-9]
MIKQCVAMGIVKISDQLHDEIRHASTVMVRSINSQAEFWIKVGRLAERNPNLTFAEIMEQELLRQCDQQGERNE